MACSTLELDVVFGGSGVVFDGSLSTTVLPAVVLVVLVVSVVVVDWDVVVGICVVEVVVEVVKGLLVVVGTTVVV